MDTYARHPLARARKAAGYRTQQALAEEIGVYSTTVTRWERREQGISAEYVRRLYALLKPHITLAELLGIDDTEAA